jgi:hypothetical protein
MRAPYLSLLTALFTLASFTGCSSEDDPSGGAGAGSGGASGGSAGSGAGTGGSGGASGGSAGASAGTSGSGGASGGSAGASAGTSGSGGATGGSAGAAGSSGSGTVPDAPTDTTQAGIEAFLDALAYKGSTWAPDQAMPHDSGADYHGMVQSWFNTTLRQSNADGDTRFDAGSMVVKEIYSGASVIGHAVMLRNGETQTIYYCTATEAGRCYSDQPANEASYSTSAAENCGCHGGGTIITTVPPP